MRIHPLTKIAKNLLAGLVPVQRLELRPLVRLRLTDEGEHRLRENSSVSIEAFASDWHIAVCQEMRLDDRLESGFGMSLIAHAGIRASFCCSHHAAT